MSEGNHFIVGFEANEKCKLYNSEQAPSWSYTFAVAANENSEDFDGLMLAPPKSKFVSFKLTEKEVTHIYNSESYGETTAGRLTTSFISAIEAEYKNEDGTPGLLVLSLDIKESEPVTFKSNNVLMNGLNRYK